MCCEPATSGIEESMTTGEESGVPELSPVSVSPNTRCGVHVVGNISSTYPPVVVSPNEAYGAIDEHEQATTGNREDNCVVIEGVPPPDVSPNMAYSPHENVSPRNTLANAIAINPNEAYGVPAEVNVSSLNHPTDAAIVVNPNEAYGVPAEVNISSTNHPTDAAIVVNPNEAYGVPAEVNISSTNHPTDAAIVVNPNEAYGVPAEVNVLSTNHPTDAALLLNSNEAHGAIDTHEQGTTRNHEDNVAMETDCEYYYATV